MRNRFFFVFTFLLCFAFVTVAFAIPVRGYRVEHKNGFYFVKVNIQNARIVPYVSETLETVEAIAKKTNANVVINTGFFDASNKKTVSFIVDNGVIVANPIQNENLLKNQDLIPHLDKIFNRGEFRLLSCNDKIEADIVYRGDTVLNDCTILNSTQAGPIILPVMDLEKEFFLIEKENKILRDSIGATRKTARSLLAIKGDWVYFMITDDDTQLSLYEVEQRLKKMGFEKALGLDGGGSVSLFLKQNNIDFYRAREKNNISRPIKSALLVF